MPLVTLFYNNNNLISQNNLSSCTINGGVTSYKNNIYGVTKNGGQGFGNIYKYSPDDNIITILYEFSEYDNNGIHPNENMIVSKDETVLYGTCSEGGYNGQGTVFSIPIIGGKPTVLHTFNQYDNKGICPDGGLTLDKSGQNLYGACYLGGNGFGTIYSISIPTKSITLLHAFDGINASSPDGGVRLSEDESLVYGAYLFGAYGYGAIFSVPITGGDQKDQGKLNILYAFEKNGLNGANPNGGLLLSDDKTGFYGTCLSGGLYNEGTIFFISLTGSVTSLYSFKQNNLNGIVPNGWLVQHENKLYGTCSSGGFYNKGTIFSFSLESQTIDHVHSFDIANPNGGLTLHNNILCGTTSNCVYQLI